MGKKVVGIDISKDWFDASFVVEGRERCQRFSNDRSGFEALFSAVAKESMFVMEATGVYFLELGVYLSAHQRRVAVINPLVIKRFGQMELLRAKTDKADAKLIRRYGETVDVSLWAPPKAVISELNQLDSWLEGLIRARNAADQPGACERAPARCLVFCSQGPRGPNR